MRCKLTIPGRLPSLNDYTDENRKHWSKGAKFKRLVEEDLSWIIKSQLRGIQFKKPVVMKYIWIEPDRTRDKDNIAFAKKFIQDALVHMKVLKNDGWAEIEYFTDAFDVDPKNPRVEVIIEEYEGRKQNVSKN